MKGDKEIITERARDGERERERERELRTSLSHFLRRI